MERNVPVYSKDRSQVIAYVNKLTTSIGAAKAAGYESAKRAFVSNRPIWVALGSKTT